MLATNTKIVMAMALLTTTADLALRPVFYHQLHLARTRGQGEDAVSPNAPGRKGGVKATSAMLQKIVMVMDSLITTANSALKQATFPQPRLALIRGHTENA